MKFGTQVVLIGTIEKSYMSKLSYHDAVVSRKVKISKNRSFFIFHFFQDISILF